MNFDNLHELIERYEANLPVIYDKKNDELFKWRAMKVWQEEWFKPAACFDSFADRFSAARKEFSLLIDNSRMHPSNGVLKLWEKEPETVEHLFQNVLFADSGQDVSVVQDHMDCFLADYESLRQKYFPGSWSYKQDRHSASVFLAMNAPSSNFIFKSSEAATMAKYIDFGFNIGAGMTFSLKNYYKLCDEIISALKEHGSLLEKHFAYLDDTCYYDESLHLLTFDLMYCCRTYSFYKGLTVPSTGKTIKKAAHAGPSDEEIAHREEERLEKIAMLEQEIDDLERSIDGCDDISLLSVQVSSQKYGDGTVVAQDINKITVCFSDTTRVFILDKKYIARPRFENDEEIVSAFTQYGYAQEKIQKLQKQISELQNQ